MKCPSLSSKGFSLIELMIVVVVIGILAAVTIPAYFNHIMRARQADAYHNMLDIKAAQEMYYSLNNTYEGPSSLEGASSTFRALLNFSYSDTTYYAYSISDTAGGGYTALATGSSDYSKLDGNVIRIRDDEDPCMQSPGNLKQSLGLDPCP